MVAFTKILLAGLSVATAIALPQPIAQDGAVSLSARDLSERSEDLGLEKRQNARKAQLLIGGNRVIFRLLVSLPADLAVWTAGNIRDFVDEELDDYFTMQAPPRARTFYHQSPGSVGVNLLGTNQPRIDPPIGNPNRPPPASISDWGYELVLNAATTVAAQALQSALEGYCRSNGIDISYNLNPPANGASKRDAAPIDGAEGDLDARAVNPLPPTITCPANNPIDRRFYQYVYDATSQPIRVITNDRPCGQ